jgi:hypothetical protein
MKHSARFLSLLLLVSAGFVASNCGSDDGGGTSQQQTQFTKLQADWTVSSVSGTSGTDWNEQFQGGVLNLAAGNTFSEGGEFSYGFTVPGGVVTSPWPANGLWKFGSNAGSNLTRLDSKISGGDSFPDVPMTYKLENSDKTLTIEFDIPEGTSYAITAGKTASVTGHWEFTFTRP